MQFKNFEDLEENAKLSPDVVEGLKQIKKSTVLYEKIKVLSENAARMTDDLEQAYILHSRCLCLYKRIHRCDDFHEFSKFDEFEHCCKIVKHSLDETGYLKDYLKAIYASTHSVDHQDFGTTIQLDQLIDYVKSTGKIVLILDYRREKIHDSFLHAHDSIKIVPLDPSLLQQTLDFTQLHHSVDYPHHTTLSDIQNFDLVVLIGDKLEDEYLTPNLLKSLTSYNVTHNLKRDPLLLEDEIKKSMTEREIEQLGFKFSSLKTISSDLVTSKLDEQQELADLTRVYKCAMGMIERSSSLEQTLLGHTGLSSLGNTCFMNSAFQALFNTPGMHKLFTNKNFINQINPKNKSRSAGLISACFSALMDSIWSGRFKYINPSCFLSLFANKVNSELADRRQHDAQEFFSCLLNALHEETNQVDEKKPFLQEYDGKDIQEDANHYFKALKLFESSPIQDLFDLTSVMTLTCLTCNTSSVTFENMPLLLLEMPAEKYVYCPLSDCLDHYFGNSVLKDSQKWDCPTCKSKQSAERSLQVWNLPPILVICLKRFAAKHGQNGATGEVRKNSINIDFGIDTLDMSPYNHESSESNLGSQYKLFAVTNHEGSLHQGHYTSFVENQWSGWIKFNDQRVSSMSSSDVQSKNAYILYFRKTSM